MAAFSNQIHNRPVILPLLQMVEPEGYRLMSPEAASQEECKQSPVTFVLEPIPSWRPPKSDRLICVSQLPRRTPSFFKPLMRLMPAAASALKRPQSALRRPIAEQRRAGDSPFLELNREIPGEYGSAVQRFG
jgi:hypothetical protein